MGRRNAVVYMTRHLLNEQRSGLVINLSFSLRLLCLAVPFNRDQQIWLINLLTKRGLGLKFLHCYGSMLGLDLTCMYVLVVPWAISFGSLPTWRLKNGKVA